MRSSKDLNNQIELDHRGVKLRLDPMLGVKRFSAAAIKIGGIELPRRIHKEQLNCADDPPTAGHARIDRRALPKSGRRILRARRTSAYALAVSYAAPIVCWREIQSLPTPCLRRAPATSGQGLRLNCIGRSAERFDPDRPTSSGYDAGELPRLNLHQVKHRMKSVRLETGL